MKATLALAVVVTVLAACSGDDGGEDQRPLTRIDGPAQVDPDIVEGGTNNRSDSDG